MRLAGNALTSSSRLISKGFFDLAGDPDFIGAGVDAGREVGHVPADIGLVVRGEEVVLEDRPGGFEQGRAGALEDHFAFLREGAGGEDFALALGEGEGDRAGIGGGGIARGDGEGAERGRADHHAASAGGEEGIVGLHGRFPGFLGYITVFNARGRECNLFVIYVKR
jgi:hypothetical protein